MVPVVLAVRCGVERRPVICCGRCLPSRIRSTVLEIRNVTPDARPAPSRTVTLLAEPDLRATTSSDGREPRRWREGRRDRTGSMPTSYRLDFFIMFTMFKRTRSFSGIRGDAFVLLTEK